MARRFHFPVPGASAAPGLPATGRAKPSCNDPAVEAAAEPSEERAIFVWRDPITGESLTLEFVAAPGLIAQLESAGFERVDKATDPSDGTAAA